MFAEKKMIRNMRIAMLSLLGATASTWVFADALVISNMAVGEYKEEGSTVVQVARSNLVQTTVIPVYNLSLKDNRTEYVRPGQAVYYHHVLTNTGNERDLYNLLGSQIAGGSFTHSNIEIYLDADRNGVADNNTPMSQYSLNAGETVALIIKAIIPSSAAVNSSSQIQLTATSTQQPSLTQNNIDTSRITDQAVLNLTKSFDKTTVVNGDIATVRLTYFNNGNNSGVVNISDLLDTTQLTYVTGNENWNGQALNSATGSNDPTGINYYLDTDGKTIRAQITNVPANAQGYIEFRVRVARTAPGEIPNFANMDYDHDSSTTTPNLVTQSNTAVLSIKPIYGVVINADANSVSGSDLLEKLGASSGGTVVFENYVWNTGTVADRFNLTFNSHNLPIGSVLEFYRADGVTPLFDSNNDGIVDTGTLDAGAKLPIIVKVTFPADYIDTANTIYNIAPKAQSITDSTKTDMVQDRTSLIQSTASRLVDLINSPETTVNGTGNGNVSNGGSPWKILAGVNNQTVVFPLTVRHTGQATAYSFSADADNNFATVALPSDISSVRYFASSTTDCSVLGAEITSTRLLNNGESQLYCAVVEIRADAKSTTQPIPIYFKVASSSLPTSAPNSGYDVIQNAITISSNASQGGVSLEPDLRGQIAPGGSIVYTHTLKPWGTSVLSATDNFSVANDRTGFTTTLYYDANNDGQLDASDPIIQNLSIVNAAILSSKSPIRIFNKVENTAYNTVGVANASVISLKNSAGTILDTATDITTITSAPVRLSKLQAKDNNCDGVADGVYTSNILPITRNSDGSGQCVLYQLTVNNLGASAIGRFNFYDYTPEAMVMSKAPTCTSCESGSLSAPALGQTGAIKASVAAINSNESHSLEFGVKYVGN
ncbi:MULTISPECIES: DUF11 domain-containing protein [Acinetobacter]|uniref:DUF11 domain-containing protein n=1 Tax=Acinetobacter TaxID=469 RepID=UPI0007385565|nr:MULTISPECIES: DUF11 domain-containing protein [Acinetobacter]AXF44150.1 DUF11 domain-containing protein [Acinetobacter johnsonii]KUG37549.1 hypothetical protein AAU60_15395 [Acinetobacter johnsonii]MDH1276612.1 DUF11 domain-containing protein [Acinetobacter johnsonii]MDH1711955.1 DUF11 domain-containing protein [Acinetobacter johnsonii]UNT43224.1 DUF11 domain-containing protein [Acinetobacter sp. LUNF3]